MQPEFPIWTSPSRIICSSYPGHNDLNSPGRRSALLFASAWKLPHLETGCAPGAVEGENGIQPDSGEGGGRARGEEFLLGIGPQAFELRKQPVPGARDLVRDLLPRGAWRHRVNADQSIQLRGAEGNYFPLRLLKSRPVVLTRNTFD